MLSVKQPMNNDLYLTYHRRGVCCYQFKNKMKQFDFLLSFIHLNCFLFLATSMSSSVKVGCLVYSLCRDLPSIQNIYYILLTGQNVRCIQFEQPTGGSIIRKNSLRSKTSLRSKHKNRKHTHRKTGVLFYKLTFQANVKFS